MVNMFVYRCGRLSPRRQLDFLFNSQSLCSFAICLLITFIVLFRVAYTERTELSVFDVQGQYWSVFVIKFIAAEYTIRDAGDVKSEQSVDLNDHAPFW